MLANNLPPMPVTVSSYVMPGLIKGSAADICLIPKIKLIVATYFGLTVDLLSVKSRKREHVTARHFAMFWCCKSTTASLILIGDNFNRHYSSVIHGRDTVIDLIIVDKPTQKHFDALSILLDEAGIEMIIN